MTTLTTILAFVVAVGILVTVHELGHYWVARWANVKILRFSVGFGRTLLSRRRGPDQTEWVLAAIPLGGYVRMLDDRDEDSQHEDLTRAFNRQSVWKRIAIVLAGPAANFLLAGVIYWALFVYGTPGFRPYIAEPAAGTPAAIAGLHNEDLLKRVGDASIESWQELRWQLLKAAVKRGSVTLEVESPGGRVVERLLSLDALTKDDLDKDFLATLGVKGFRPALEPVLGQVLAGRAAEAAGLRVGDRIAAIDAAPADSWDQLVTTISASAGKTLSLTVIREGKELVLLVTPVAEAGAAGAPVGRIGVTPQPPDPAVRERLFTTVRAGPVEAIGKSAEKIWDMSIFSLRMLGKMITGDMSWKNLSGPITIADYAGQSARLGALSYLMFVALVSISIGVLNLLPIPVLDGGQLVYYLVEILKGSPVSQRVIESGQQVGLALLLGLTAFAFYNDIHRLITG